MYLNVVQLAESFGVEESVIEGWVRSEGLPHVPERGRLLFDRAQVAAWAVQRGLASKVGFLAAEGPHAHPALRLEPMLRTGGIWREVSASEVHGLLETVVGRLPGVSPEVRKLLAHRVRTPGGIIWAPIGDGLALPHLRARVALGREAGILALVFLREALVTSEPAPDRQPVTRLLFFVAPSPRAHLELLARLSTALTRGGLHRVVLDAGPDADVFAALSSSDLADTDSSTGAGSP
jgi:PTS system nitrogen regulatory IIA component